MAEVPTCDWKGKSGQTYRYWIYPLPARFDPNQPGNYIYAKTDARGYWQPVYIGQGDLDDRANNHHQAQCIRQKTATHFHCHKNGTEQDRLQEESDLLANYTQAYQPAGCNERPGG
jgi:hypothetical protein